MEKDEYLSKEKERHVPPSILSSVQKESTWGTDLQLDEDGERQCAYADQMCPVPELGCTGCMMKETEPTKFEEGVKFDNLKVRYELIPAIALNLLAQLYTKGAWKYEAENWRKGLAWSRCYGALQRHANAYAAGEWLDPQLKLPHLTCVMFCCCSLVEFYYSHPDFDDRPKVDADVHLMKFEYSKEEYQHFKEKLNEKSPEEPQPHPGNSSD